MRAMPTSIGTIHFIGIGGIGMSGIAEVLHNLGYKVQGSDISDSGNVERLRKLGIPVAVGHHPGNINEKGGGHVSVVVISTAIKPTNPELIAARDAKLPIVRRADMLAELMRLKWSVAVAGTHGKTTTTSLVANMLDVGGFDPTVINGGIINAYGTNTRLGAGDWMVVEADESDGTFTRLPATVAVVTNIDPEHLDYYGTYDAIKGAFKRFIENLPFYGFAVMCTDHPAVQGLISHLSDKRIITYGFNPQADVRGTNIRSDAFGSTFDVHISANMSEDGAERHFQNLRIPMLGHHNISNALSSIAVGYQMGMNEKDIRQALETFSGVKRRFTRTGVTNGITVIDDYGHHPVEIAAVLKAGRSAVDGTGKGGRVIAVVQPHRYTRLSSLFEDFASCMNDADTVIVADVYAAGEDPIEDINGPALATAIKRHGHKDVHVLKTASDLAPMVADMAQSGDFVICLGAGNITQWAYALPKELEAILNERDGTNQ